MRAARPARRAPRGSHSAGKDVADQIGKQIKNGMQIWVAPEGTRSKDGKVHEFKRGISIFAQKTHTPILFLYIDGSSRLWPKGAIFAKPGKLIIHIGPVQEPTNIEEVYKNYLAWVKTIDPSVLPDDMTEENEVAPQQATLQEMETDDDSNDDFKSE